MEFPRELWKIVKDYLIDYRKHWMKAIRPFLMQLNAFDNTLIHAAMRDGLPGGRPWRFSWFNLPSTRIRGQGLEFRNGFTYRLSAVYYPKSASGSVVTPRALTTIARTDSTYPYTDHYVA